MGDLEREEGRKEAITEAKSLMSGRQIEHNSADILRISGSLDGRIERAHLWQNKSAD